MADDLRWVIAAIKITPDLERIGDLAKNIAKRALVLNRADPMRITQGLAAMGRQALGQLVQVMDASAQRDAAKARAVRLRDEAIDEMYNSLFRELLTYMMEDPRTIGLCTHLLFVAKNLERIGDHATNIAETTIFAIEGRYLTDERPKSDVTSTLEIKG
jgi:phosphate transport system protein